MPFTFISILIYSTKQIRIFKPLRPFMPLLFILLLLARHWSMPRFIKISFYKKGGDTTVLCPSCGFQSSNRVSTPRLVSSSTRKYSPAITTYFSMVSPCMCKVDVWREPYNHVLPNIFPLQTPATTRHLLTVYIEVVYFCFALNTKRYSERWQNNFFHIRCEELFYIQYLISGPKVASLPRKTRRENQLAEKVKQLIK